MPQPQTNPWHHEKETQSPAWQQEHNEDKAVSPPFLSKIIAILEMTMITISQ